MRSTSLIVHAVRAANKPPRLLPHTPHHAPAYTQRLGVIQESAEERQCLVVEMHSASKTSQALPGPFGKNREQAASRECPSNVKAHAPPVPQPPTTITAARYSRCSHTFGIDDPTMKTSVCRR